MQVAVVSYVGELLQVFHSPVCHTPPLNTLLKHTKHFSDVYAWTDNATKAFTQIDKSSGLHLTLVPFYPTLNGTIAVMTVVSDVTLGLFLP